jgi:hypothetical protein
VKWVADSQDPGGVIRSEPERFVIVTRPSNDPGHTYWLTDLASNSPPNPPKGFVTAQGAKDYAESLGDRT